jgi:hypothetical protein
LTAITFQIGLINGCWDFFQGIWKHRNDTLHDNDEGLDVEHMNVQIATIYNDIEFFVRPSQYSFLRMYTKDECIALPPYTNFYFSTTTPDALLDAYLSYPADSFFGASLFY